MWRSKSASRVKAEISFPETCLLGRRSPAYRWHDSSLGLYKQLREPSCLGANRKGTRSNDLRLKVERPADGAELTVGAMNAGNAAGAKGQRQYGWHIVNLQEDEL
jgi:hypothetical protein